MAPHIAPHPVAYHICPTPRPPGKVWGGWGCIVDPTLPSLPAALSGDQDDAQYASSSRPWVLSPPETCSAKALGVPPSPGQFRTRARSTLLRSPALHVPTLYAAESQKAPQRIPQVLTSLVCLVCLSKCRVPLGLLPFAPQWHFPRAFFLFAVPLYTLLGSSHCSLAHCNDTAW